MGKITIYDREYSVDPEPKAAINVAHDAFMLENGKSRFKIYKRRARETDEELRLRILADITGIMQVRAPSRASLRP